MRAKQVNIYADVALLSVLESIRESLPLPVTLSSIAKECCVRGALELQREVLAGSPAATAVPPTPPDPDPRG